MLCGAIAVYALQPWLETMWDIDNTDDDNKFIAAYVGYGVFCLAVYYFVIAPWLELPELDLSQI